MLVSNVICHAFSWMFSMMCTKHIWLTLSQVMACCLMAPSHNLSKCWSKYMLPYGVTRPQWVNSCSMATAYNINGLVQERCNSIANALELCFSCTNSSIYIHALDVTMPGHTCTNIQCLMMIWLSTWLHQAITWTNADFSLVRLCGIHLGAIKQRVSKLLFCLMSLKTVLLNYLVLSHHQGCMMSQHIVTLWHHI